MQQIYAAAILMAGTFSLFGAQSAMAEPALRIVVSEQVCNALVQGGNEIDVAYRPGIDVHGRPVRPADLNGPNSLVPMPITFDVSVDIAEQLGLGSELEARLSVAQISERDGEILINGSPASHMGQSIARDACLEH